MRFEDLTGRQFERLTVIRRAKGNSPKHTYWECRCECGNIVVATSQKLKSGHTKSCGCYARDRARKYGLYNERLYRIWRNIRQRCSNPNMQGYEYYGGRGIEVCEEWNNDFRAFHDWALANGYQENLTIDRRDVNGNYEPSNCRWVTMRQQGNNTRANHIIEFGGEVHTLAEWAKLLNISQKTLSNRVLRGWSIERALTEPVRRKKI